VGVGAPCPPRVDDSAGARLERLILDTSVLVASERIGSNLDAVVADDDDVAIAAITAAELLVGVELASKERCERRREFVERILRSVPVEAYDLVVARAHASLLAYTRRSGVPRGAHDLIIAATAVASDRSVVSADAQAFDGLPGLRSRLLL
jgi:tRNA(fMet)-specific endonuclease VapC